MGQVGVAAPRTITFRATASGLTAVGAGLGLMLGSFLPWAKVTAPLIGTATKSGMEGGDGLITVGAGVALLVLGVVLMGASDRRATVGVVVMVVAVCALAFCIFEFVHLSHQFADVQSGEGGDLVALSYGSGLWLVGLASVAGGVGGVLAFADR